MPLKEKIVSREQAAEIAEDVRAQGKRVVFTNGCFDLLHAGHALYLEQARALGDFLIVGLNSDKSVSAIKGAGRPIVGEKERAQLLAALGSVGLVVIFEEPVSTPLLDLLRPDVFVKGGDYTKATMNQEEKNLVESNGGGGGHHPRPARKLDHAHHREDPRLSRFVAARARTRGAPIRMAGPLPAWPRILPEEGYANPGSLFGRLTGGGNTANILHGTKNSRHKGNREWHRPILPC